jgi:chromosome segregation ATPase
MGKIIQFPSKDLLNTQEEIDMLNHHLELVEDDLKVMLEQLDELNEEIVALTIEYNSILSKLKGLVLKV